MNNINIPFNIDYITIKTYNKNLLVSDQCLLTVRLLIEDIISQK
jgi:hypothetical protein